MCRRRCWRWGRCWRCCNGRWGLKRRMASSDWRIASGYLLATPHSLLAVSTPTKRIIPLVFPIAALVVVGDFHRDDVFRVLEAELCRHPDLHREAVGAGQNLVRVFERHLR